MIKKLFAIVQLLLFVFSSSVYADNLETKQILNKVYDSTNGVLKISGSPSFTLDSAQNFDWTGGNVQTCSATTSTALQACVDAATAGDTVKLISGGIVFNSSVTIAKALAIIGAGNSNAGTTITDSGTIANGLFVVTASNVLIQDMKATTTSTNRFVFIDGTAGTVLSNVNIQRVSVYHTGGSAPDIRIDDASAYLYDVFLNNSSTSTSNWGLYIQNNSTAEAATSVQAVDLVTDVAGASTHNYGVQIAPNSATKNSTFTCRNCSINGTGTDSYGVNTTAHANAVANIYNSYINGGTADVLAGATSSITISGVNLANNTVSGTITYAGTLTSSKLKVDFTAAAGGDTACSTTCGTANCVAGFDAGTSALVACDAATADSCICS